MNTDDCHRDIKPVKTNDNWITEYLLSTDKEKFFSDFFSKTENAKTVVLPTEKLNKYAAEKLNCDIDYKALNEQFAVSAKKHVKDINVKFAASIGPSQVQIEPFGDISFTELISAYDEQINIIDQYVDFYVLKNMRSMADIRAALISCKKTDKPIYVFIDTDDDGSTIEYEVPALGALITVQEMGADGFGINCPDEKICSGIEQELLQYAKIPVIKHCTEICEPLKKIKDDFFIFTHYNNIYFLEADTTEISSPIRCQPEMEEIISDVCETSCDILRVEIISSDDAIDFARNAHMSTLPVMFLSDNEIALKMALMLYQGIAMIDSSTMIPENILSDICKKYGAVIY